MASIKLAAIRIKCSTVLPISTLACKQVEQNQKWCPETRAENRSHSASHTPTAGDELGFPVQSVFYFHVQRWAAGGAWSTFLTLLVVEARSVWSFPPVPKYQPENRVYMTQRELLWIISHWQGKLKALQEITREFGINFFITINRSALQLGEESSTLKCLVTNQPSLAFVSLFWATVQGDNQL